MELLNKKINCRQYNKNKNSIASISFNNNSKKINAVAIISKVYLEDNFNDSKDIWLKKVELDLELSSGDNFEDGINYMPYASDEKSSEELIKWAKDNNIR